MSDGQTRRTSPGLYIEGAGGLFFGDGFGGVTANAGIAYESNGIRYVVRHAYSADSRMIQLQGPPLSRIDVMREAVVMAGIVEPEGPGIYAGTLGIGWAWGRYASPATWGRFGVLSVCLEAFGGVTVFRSVRLGLHARGNINRVRTTASINAVGSIQIL